MTSTAILDFSDSSPDVIFFIFDFFEPLMKRLFITHTTRVITAISFDFYSFTAIAAYLSVNVYYAK